MQNGVVLSLLSSDATASPQQIIPQLGLDAPLAKGIQVGQWTLELPAEDGTGVPQKDDEEAQERGPVVIVDGLLEVGLGGTSGANAPSVTPKYSFRMRLGLRSKPTGRYVSFSSTRPYTERLPHEIDLPLSRCRWNKLDILRYESVHLSTDEAVPLPLKHERPYWFSKVRSYGSGMS